MTYFHTLPARRRTRSHDATKNAVFLQFAVALALAALLSAALSFSGLQVVSPTASDDWHGNVARSNSGG